MNRRSNVVGVRIIMEEQIEGVTKGSQFKHEVHGTPHNNNVSHASSHKSVFVIWNIFFESIFILMSFQGFPVTGYLDSLIFIYTMTPSPITATFLHNILNYYVLKPIYSICYQKTPLRLIMADLLLGIRGKALPKV